MLTGAGAAVDEQDSLRKVPLLFQDLLKERGVFDAARCMVELLFPDAKSTA